MTRVTAFSRLTPERAPAFPIGAIGLIAVAVTSTSLPAPTFTVGSPGFTGSTSTTPRWTDVMLAFPTGSTKTLKIVPRTLEIEKI